MTNPQGTDWETSIVKRAVGRQLEAIRLVKKSQKDEADVIIYGGPRQIGAVFWKRIVGKKKQGKPRQPLGERYTVTVTEADFLDMLALIPQENRPTVYIQAKWSAQLSVTKTLYGLRQWMRTH
jgi:hypothetical protein